MKIRAMTKSLPLACALVVISATAFAQTPPTPPASTSPLATPMGHAFNISAQHYNYTEPDDVDISIHGPKVGAEYTGTFSINQRHRWFAQLNVRGTGPIAAYDGWCRPWQITPSSTSANGYRLTLGTRSPCSETGDADWYVEGRALAGKDFIARTWSLSPFVGIGARHLSNGTTGNFNYRTQEYLYAPIGATLRTTALGTRVLGVTVEYDILIRGWNTTRNSLLTGGTVPATSTTPAFTIGDFTDLSFKQRKGHAVRASASMQLSRKWSIEPYLQRWRVNDSSINAGSVAYTVNAITARQTINYLEPHNFTHEVGVKIGLRLGGR